MVNISLSIQVIIIGKFLVWCSNVNYFSCNTEEDYVIRISDTLIAENIIEILYD